MKIEKYKYIKKITFTFLLIALSVFGLENITAQTTNLNLPDIDGGGNAPYDVLVANDYLFVYAGSKIVVYNSNTRIYIDEITLSTKNFGKFNPTYYNERLHGTSNLMATNSNGSELFVITPELEIRRYSTVYIDNEFELLERKLPQHKIIHLSPLHGLNILKFDPNNERLYWVVKGKDKDENCPGNFHVRERYFAIYKTVENEFGNGTHLELIHDELLKAMDDYANSAISDVEYNRNPESNYFYLTKLSKMEVWQIIGDNVGLVTSINVPIGIYDTLYKFIRMLYIDDVGNNIHKIVALPYRHPVSDVNNPKMLVLDADNHSYEWVNVPSKKILDATYLSAHQDLVVSYAPDADEIIGNIDPYSDLAVFHYNNGFMGFTTMNTNQTANKSVYDLNASFQLTKVNASTALVSKKDQVIKIRWNGDTYVDEEQVEAEGNYFYKGTSTGTKSFIVNMVGCGVEVFNISSIHEKTINMGFSANNIIANTTGSKLYMFNKLNSENTGIFVHSTISGETINLNFDGIDGNEINGMIGDVVYNPYQKQFLVAQSNFASDTYIIKVINDDADNNSGGTIQLPAGVTHPKAMYIGPDKRLYVMANMQSDSPNPTVCVYAADDVGNYNAHDLIFHDNVYFSGTFTDKFEYWSAQFGYDAYNNKVYASIHPTEYTLDPYVSVPNSMFDYTEPYLTTGSGTGTGSFVYFENDEVMVINNDLMFPGKIICPTTLSNSANSQYAEKIFVIGEKLYEYNLVTRNKTVHNMHYNDIAYSPEQDMLFALRDVGALDCPNDRRIRIDKIYYNGNTLTFEEIDLGTEDGRIKGQSAGMFYNPYDMYIYIHLKFDNNKYGATNVSLQRFDPLENDPTLDIIDLDITSFYPELDHNIDYHSYFYPINQSYINPYNNKIYVPNGAHSKVSVVDFVPREPLLLNPVNKEKQSFTWVSFPRLNRVGGAPTVQQVLGGAHIAPDNYEVNSQLENLPPDADVEDKVYNIYTEYEWEDAESDLKKIHSPRGYKLMLNYRAEQEGIEPHLYLDGAVVSPSTPVTLHADEKENWTGYWLYPTQDIFDALGDAVHDLNSIKHQDWTCLRGLHYGIGDPEPGAENWYCDKNIHNIRYGEMVILKAGNDIPGFQWNIGGLAAAHNGPAQNPSYFSYEEQAAYTPLLVELDTTSQALEIGAMINGSCIGATVVNPGDSIVVIRAYMENTTSDSVTFEMYYGTKSTAQSRISSYYVWDKHLNAFTKRALQANEKEDYYFISLKKQKEKESKNSLSPIFSVWPNPTSGSMFYNIVLEEDTHVTISLFDIAGKLLARPLEEPLSAGSLKGELLLENTKGGKLLPGVYFVQLKAGDFIETKKVIVK